MGLVVFLALMYGTYLLAKASRNRRCAIGDGDADDDDEEE